MLEQRVIPVRRRVELEARTRVAIQAAVHAVGARRFAEPQRDDERDRRGRAGERLVERAAGLAQREVECRALHAPAAVVAVDLEVGSAGREQVDLVEMAREGVEGPGAGQRQHRPVVLLSRLRLGVVDDVLAQALVAGAVQVKDRRAALELLAEAPAEALQLVVLDLEGKVCDALVGAHPAPQCTHSRRPASHHVAS
jgi:hypothetical protein